MSTTWPHHLRLFGAGPATPSTGYTDDDGVWHDDASQPDTLDVYNGLADVQDGGKMFSRDRGGDLVDKSDAVAFLKNKKVIPALELLTNLKAEITWEDGSISNADVIKVRRLDATVWLRRV